ncbi:MAG: hypothetical protein V7K28_07725 [Nostoc sp.]
MAAFLLLISGMLLTLAPHPNIRCFCYISRLFKAQLIREFHPRLTHFSQAIFEQFFLKADISLPREQRDFVKSDQKQAIAKNDI